MSSDAAIACAHELQLKAFALRKEAARANSECDPECMRLMLEKAARFELGAEALYALIKH